MGKAYGFLKGLFFGLLLVLRIHSSKNNNQRTDMVIWFKDFPDFRRENSYQKIFCLLKCSVETHTS